MECSRRSEVRAGTLAAAASHDPLRVLRALPAGGAAAGTRGQAFFRTVDSFAAAILPKRTIHTGNRASSASVTQARGAFAAGAAMPTMTSSGGCRPSSSLILPVRLSFGRTDLRGAPAIRRAPPTTAQLAQRADLRRGTGGGCRLRLRPAPRVTFDRAPRKGMASSDPVRQPVPLGSVLASHPCSDGGERAGDGMRSRHSVWRCPPRS
jgi:hypothetical protein